ncbi:MAG TPA: endolytic transglycosylase MltG [Usitatibacter sp.]|nr:endolytic transglycosylase MltG [Usitatibacter sp.]
MMRAIRNLLLLAIVLAAAAAGWLYYFNGHPLELPRTPYEFTVRSGASVKSLARQLADDGLLAEPHSFWILARALGRSGAIQAGTYRLERPLTPRELLDKLARGDVVLADILFVEGTTFRQWRAQLVQHPQVRATLAGKEEPEIRAALGIEQAHIEGWLFPSTYRFAPGTSDLDLLKRAHAAMKKRLAEGWAARDTTVPLKSPYEALILASIVEKETGAASERPIIAGVFANRLRRGMRLQTDPTVIYGIGEKFDGNIRKRDLTDDTPWNTYTRDGLPPTPIAMPGAGAIAAVMHPAQTEALYFVGKGDGTHYFSPTLEEHNRAVAKYQLKR